MKPHQNKKIVVGSKIATLAVFLYTILLGLDFFLPLQVTEEQIVAVHLEFGRRPRYGGRTHFSEESIKVRTEKHVFPVYYSQYKNMVEGGLMRLSVTPILGNVRAAYLIHKEMKVSVYGGIYDIFWWFPIFMFLVSGIGILFFKNHLQTVNFGVVNIILLIILFKIMRFW